MPKQSTNTELTHGLQLLARKAAATVSDCTEEKAKFSVVHEVPEYFDLPLACSLFSVILHNTEGLLEGHFPQSEVPRIREDLKHYIKAGKLLNGMMFTTENLREKAANGNHCMEYELKFAHNNFYNHVLPPLVKFIMKTKGGLDMLTKSNFWDDIKYYVFKL